MVMEYLYESLPDGTEGAVAPGVAATESHEEIAAKIRALSWRICFVQCVSSVTGALGYLLLCCYPYYRIRTDHKKAPEKRLDFCFWTRNQNDYSDDQVIDSEFSAGACCCCLAVCMSILALIIMYDEDFDPSPMQAVIVFAPLGYFLLSTLITCLRPVFDRLYESYDNERAGLSRIGGDAVAAAGFC